MEALLVYGLVLLFFILLAVFTSTVLKVPPYAEPEQRAPVAATTSKAVGKTGNAVAYVVLAVLFLLFCVLTALDNRETPSLAARNSGKKWGEHSG